MLTLLSASPLVAPPLSVISRNSCSSPNAAPRFFPKPRKPGINCAPSSTTPIPINRPSPSPMSTSPECFILPKSNHSRLPRAKFARDTLTKDVFALSNLNYSRTYETNRRKSNYPRTYANRGVGGPLLLNLELKTLNYQLAVSTVAPCDPP